MCIEDLWIARHTLAVRIGTVSPISVPANVNRLGFLVVGGNTVDFARTNGNAWFSARGGSIVTNWATTDTNEVPPTDNTGTIIQSQATPTYIPLVIRAEQYGQLVRDESTFLFSIVSTILYELIPDPALSELLNQLEYNKGWPLYKLPPSVKVPNG